MSVTEATYLRLRAYCEAQGIAMSAFVEARIRELPEVAQHEDLLDATTIGVSNVSR